MCFFFFCFFFFPFFGKTSQNFNLKNRIIWPIQRIFTWQKKKNKDPNSPDFKEGKKKKKKPKLTKFQITQIPDFLW
jgi:hypothetical protein